MDFTVPSGKTDSAKKDELFIEKAEKEKAERIPHEIPYTDIEVSLGVPWIAKHIVDEFITHLIESEPRCKAYGYQWTEYEPVTGAWRVNDKRTSEIMHSVNATVKYGTSRYNALQIIEATLNLREIRIYDPYNKYSEADTLAVLEKQRIIREEFSRWIWEDEDRRWEVEESYNKMFAGFQREHYDGRNLNFPDMNPDIRLYSYQLDAVQRIISTQNTLLAFDVGAGKTYIMIAAAMKMRSDGLSRKNVFVVPNHIVGQWEKIFTVMYPNAKVLAVDPKNFKPHMREKVLRQIKNGDYDGIIIAYSCFEMIPLSVKYITQDMEQQLLRLSQATQSLKNNVDYIWRASQLEKEKNKIRKLTNNFLNSMDYDSGEITFDELEINSIFVDEAHNYKNIRIDTNLKKLRGINTEGSAKCMDMMQKIRCVQQNNNGRGGILATGTPLCNSISDAYAMQMFLQYDTLCSMNLEKFDNWVKSFAMPEQICEIDVDTSKYRMVHRFSRFFNLPELSKLFSDIAIFHAMDSKDGLPEYCDYDDVVIPKNSPLSQYMETLCQRTESIRAKEVPRFMDNMLKVSTDGRKAALDLELVGAKQPEITCEKAYICSRKAAEIYKKYEGCSQLIFCDYSTPKSNKFNVYDKIKSYLIKFDIPEKEIAFVHSYHTESRKLELYRKVNQGVIRILIGSTCKLGIGANVQTKLKAVHHLDVPWRPADMIQREGRILRGGNENEAVKIFRYIAEGSFDAYSWQVLETKQGFISQFLQGSTYQRTVEDLEGNILTYAEVKALALAMPEMKLLAEKENECKSLKILRTKHLSEMEKLQHELNGIPDRMPDMNAAAENLKYLQSIDKNAFSQAYQAVKGVFTKDVIFGNTGLHSPCMVLGFSVRLPEHQDMEKPYIFLLRGKGSYTLQMGESANGNARRILNFLRDFEKNTEKLRDTSHKLNERREQLELELKKTEPYSEKIAECERQIAELRRKISVEEDQ